jgi:DNA-binding CsgD family transcriptional regulator
VGEPMTIASPASVMVFVEVGVGDLDAVDTAVDELVELLGDRANDGFAAVEIAYMRAASAMLHGDPETAAGVLSAIVQELLAQEVRYPTALWINHLGLAQLASGDLDGVKETVEVAREVAKIIGNSTCEASADCAEGLMHRMAGRPDLADPFLRRALAGLHEAGLLPDVVDTLEILAGVICELGNPETAARLLAAVDAVRSERGWVGWLPQVWPEMVADDRKAILAAAGSEAGTPALGLDDAVELVLRGRGARGRPSSGWGSLTPTEREVVRRVAAGKSNPEIADALFISRSTVKTHVSHVLAKLDLTSRAELAAAAVREGELSEGTT